MRHCDVVIAILLILFIVAPVPELICLNAK